MIQLVTIKLPIVLTDWRFFAIQNALLTGEDGTNKDPLFKGRYFHSLYLEKDVQRQIAANKSFTLPQEYPAIGRGWGQIQKLSAVSL